QRISATGRIEASVMCECVRCLSPFLVRLDIPVATQLVPARPLLPPGEYRMPPEEAEDYHYQDDVVVLDDLVRQEVILAVPLSPQCRQPKLPHYTCLTCGTYKGQEVIAVEEA